MCLYVKTCRGLGMSCKRIDTVFEVADLQIIDGDRGKNYPQQTDFINTGYCLFLNAGNVTGNGFVFNDTAFISKDKDCELRKGKLLRHDVVLTTRGTVGNVAYYGDDIKYENIRINSGMVIVRPNKMILHPYYLYIFMRSAFFKAQVKSLVTGSAQPQLPIRDINKINLYYFDYGTQLRIVNIIKSVDDRIDLLKETNTTLEAIAQAIFKSWFVDFDPVHAKQQGVECAGIDTATADLFPSSFVQSELGLIPEGWTVKGLDDIATYLNGLALQKFPPQNNESLPVIKIAQLRKGDTDGADKAGTYIKPEYIVKDGDVLFSWSGTLEVDIWCGGDGALNQHLFKVSSTSFSKWFYYYWTKYYLAEFRRIAEGKATTMGHIQRAHLTNAKVLVPPVSLLKAMDNIFNPLVSKMISNAISMKTLASLRNTLLPRLMSGKLNLSEIEEQLEGVA
jgi:type I restriction enzyme S subunit